MNLTTARNRLIQAGPMRWAMLGGLSPEEIGGLRRAATICAVIFFADASHSVVIPIFPAFAEGLGANLAMIGLYGSAVGVAMVLLSIPIGSLSDRLGRKGVMLVGFALFTLVPIAYILSSTPIQLLAARLILGVAQGSTFGIGFVWVHEATSGRARSLAHGLYMTSMGIGFTTGPILGGYATSAWGYDAAFIISSLLGAVGLVCLLLVRSGPEPANIERSRVSMREALADPHVLAAGVSNFINSLLYSTLITFYPLYGALIGLASSEIGLGLTVRGLLSTVIRFPSGAVSRGRVVLPLVFASLGGSAAILILMSWSTSLFAILALMGAQGLVYGVYLTAGNIYVTQEAHPEHRGAAMGVYSSFANVSNVVCPLVIGGVGQFYGLGAAFQAAGAASLVGVASAMLFLKRATSQKLAG